MERLYEIINKVQLQDKKLDIYIEDESIEPIAENIMSDVGIEFKKKRDIGRFYYHLSPVNRDTIDDLPLDIDDDEITTFFDDM